MTVENVQMLFFVHSSGSIIVDYRVSWLEDEDDKMSTEMMQSRMSEYLKENNNYLSMYLVDTNSIAVARVADICMTNPTELGYYSRYFQIGNSFNNTTFIPQM